MCMVQNCWPPKWIVERLENLCQIRNPTALLAYGKNVAWHLISLCLGWWMYVLFMFFSHLVLGACYVGMFRYIDPRTTHPPTRPSGSKDRDSILGPQTPPRNTSGTWPGRDVGVSRGPMEMSFWPTDRRFAVRRNFVSEMTATNNPWPIHGTNGRFAYIWWLMFMVFM